MKVSKAIPKAERPGRPGAKREAVEKGLTEAATKLSNVSEVKSRVVDPV